MFILTLNARAVERGPLWLFFLEATRFCFSAYMLLPTHKRVNFVFVLTVSLMIAFIIIFKRKITPFVESIVEKPILVIEYSFDKFNNNNNTL